MVYKSQIFSNVTQVQYQHYGMMFQRDKKKKIYNSVHQIDR